MIFALGQAPAIPMKLFVTAAAMPQYEVTLNRDEGYRQNYDWMSGTSMACPYVAGQAGLILAAHSSFTNDDIGNIIRASTKKDITSPEYIGTGRINSYEAVLITDPPTAIAEISSPSYESTFGPGIIPIEGSATGNNYVVEYSDGGPYDDNWTFFKASGVSVSNGELAKLDTDDLTIGDYFIKLRVADETHVLVDQTKIRIDKTYQLGWPQSLDDGRAIYSSPVCADFDGDRTNGKELFAVSYQGTACLWKADGTIYDNAGWPQAFPGSRVYGTPAAVDLDNDGDLEIILTISYSGAGVYIYHHDGSKFEGSGWPYKFPNPYYTTVSCSPAIGDISGNGQVEIVVSTHVVGSNEVQIHALNLQGRQLPFWPYKIFSNDEMDMHDGTVALADFNNDNNLEIVVTSYDANPDLGYPGLGRILIHVLDGDADLLPGWDPPQERATAGVRRPSVGDVDNDGDLEIFFDSNAPGGVYGLDHYGNDLWGWPKFIGVSVLSGVTLADLDGDEDLEIVFQDWHGNVLVYQHDGSFVLNKRIGDTMSVMGIYFNSAPSVDDINDDGENEIIVGSASSSELHAFDINGNDVAGFPKKISHDGYTQILSTPSTCDIDNDGDVEVIVGGRDGKVHVWDLPADLNTGPREWSMFQHDLRNTGHYPLAGANRAPNSPSDPYPPDDEPGTRIPIIGTILSWLGLDPDGDPLTYDVFFGNTTSPSLLGDGNITVNSYDLDDPVFGYDLDSNTTYYWRVTAYDDSGNWTQSDDIWSFITELWDNVRPTDAT
ncbi:FG-GAP-like repeat-containing protein, partial [Candidatus Omnitrophota bacterium]